MGFIVLLLAVFLFIFSVLAMSFRTLMLIPPTGPCCMYKFRYGPLVEHLFVCAFLFLLSQRLFLVDNTMCMSVCVCMCVDSSLPWSFVSLFQLVTLDSWFRTQADIARVVNPALVVAFFVLWVWIGAFIFRNIFIGILGTPFADNVLRDSTFAVCMRVCVSVCSQAL